MEDSLKCDYDTSPFNDEEINITNQDLETINKFEMNFVEKNETNQTYEKIIKFNNVKMTLLIMNSRTYIVKEESKTVTKILKTHDGKLIYQYYRNDHATKKYKNDQKNNQITKLIENDVLQISITKEENYLLIDISEKTETSVLFTNMKSIYCKETAFEKIKKVFDRSNNTMQTALLYENSRYYQASGNNSKVIIMKAGNNHMYQNSLEEFDNVKSTFEEQVFIKKSIDNLFKLPDTTMMKSEYLPVIFVNNGIINNKFLILISHRYHECLETHDISKFQEKFQKVSDTELKFYKTDENDFHASTGFLGILGSLVYILPEGDKYMSTDADLIQQSFDNHESEHLDYCGLLTYVSEDEKQIRVVNYGIFEDGKLVKESKNLFDLEFVYKYVDGSNEFMWMKPRE